MKILQLCHKPPFPCKDGGCLAMHTLTEGFLKNDVDLKILTLFTHKHDLELDTLDKEYLDKTKIEGVFVDTTVNIVDAFSNLITRDSYNVSRFFTPDFDRKLKHLLQRQKFDVVHVESLFMTPYVPTIQQFSKAKVVLRSHNLEYMIWDRVATGTKGKAKRAYLKYLSRMLKEYETDQLARLDGLVSISKDDLKKYEALGSEVPMLNIPFGIDISQYQVKSLPKEFSLFHIGAMDWTPNLEGLLWFLKEIWPAVVQEFPEIKFYLAGRNMPDTLTQQSFPNVEIVGEVPSAKAFMHEHSAMIVPLLSAGGIRVKIIEAMALGRAVVSTRVGAEGIDYTPGEDILIANEKEDFIASIRKLRNETYLAQLSNAGRALVAKSYNNDQLTHELLDFYKKLLD